MQEKLRIMLRGNTTPEVMELIKQEVRAVNEYRPQVDTKIYYDGSGSSERFGHWFPMVGYVGDGLTDFKKMRSILGPDHEIRLHGLAKVIWVLVELQK